MSDDKLPLTPVEILAVALSTGPMMWDTMGACQEAAIPMIAHMEAMGFTITPIGSGVLEHE